MTKLKTTLLMLATFVAVGGAVEVAQADVLDVPNSSTKNIPVVNAGNVLKDYTKNSLNAVDNLTAKGNMDRKYIEKELDFNEAAPINNYQTTADSTSSNSFKTDLYLPDGFNVTSYQHGNFQNVTMDDSGNIYFVESNGSETNLGVIIKYQLSKLKKLGTESDPMILWRAFNYYNPYTKEGITHNQQYSDVADRIKTDKQEIKITKGKLAQKSSSKLKLRLKNQNDNLKKFQDKNHALLEYAKVASAAQLSPQIDIGHGETLAFNPQNRHLYIVQDNTLTDLATRDQNNEVVEMDAQSLNPIRQYNFQMHNGTDGNLQLHTLTFDKAGNAYWGRKIGMGYMFFYGRLDKNNVQFQAAPSYMKNRGGSPNQGISYNPANDRIYYVTDDILTSIPAQQVRDGSFKPSDIHYTALTSRRECESLAFDQEGHGYLLMLWPAEIARSQKPLN